MENIEFRSGIPGSVDSSVNLQEKMIHKKETLQTFVMLLLLLKWKHMVKYLYSNLLKGYVIFAFVFQLN